MAMLFGETNFETDSCNAIHNKTLRIRNKYSYTVRIGNTAIGSQLGCQWRESSSP